MAAWALGLAAGMLPLNLPVLAPDALEEYLDHDHLHPRQVVPADRFPAAAAEPRMSRSNSKTVPEKQ